MCLLKTKGNKIRINRKEVIYDLMTIWINTTCGQVGLWQVFCRYCQIGIMTIQGQMFKCMPIITSKRIVVRANSQTGMTKKYSTA